MRGRRLRGPAKVQKSALLNTSIIDPASIVFDAFAAGGLAGRYQLLSTRKPQTSIFRCSSRRNFRKGYKFIVLESLPQILLNPLKPSVRSSYVYCRKGIR